MDADPGKETLCKVEYHPDRKRPYTVYIHDKIGKDEKPIKEQAELDHTNFILFITSKGLSPRTTKDVEEKKKAADGPEAQPPKKIPISISNIK